MSNSKFADFNLDPALAEAVAAAADHDIIEGVLKLDDPKLIPPQFKCVSQFVRICTGRFRAADTWTIRRHPNVVSFKAARPLGISHVAEAPSNSEIARRTVQGRPRFGGRGAIVAMLDFGLDWGHKSFLNFDGTTRVRGLWHQGAHYDLNNPNRYGYGRIFSRQEINAALLQPNPYQALGYYPWISDNGRGSHGTHTTDIAAGNGRALGSRCGAAPEAEILFVHLSTPRSAPGANLGDSVRMLEALDFVHRSAGELPCAINLSVGRTAGSHDGSSPFEQGMHELLSLSAGRAIAQSAGNYRQARLATHGLLREGEERELRWTIDQENTKPTEIDAWYSGNDRFLVRVCSPTGRGWVTAALGQVVDIKSDRGILIGRMYHRRQDPSNNDHHIDLFLYPNAPAGTWRLKLMGDYVIHGRFHAWIERETSRSGTQARFDADIASSSYTLGTIATSPLVLTVGAFDSHSTNAPLASFSSCGPTRDERRDKPELLAPGVQILAARSIPEGAERQESLLVELSGTSMAAPHLTGTIAAMFEAAGRPLFIDEIRDCLKMSAEPPLEARSAECYGWGRLNSTAAIAAAGKLREIAHMNFYSPTDSAPFDTEEFLDRAEREVRGIYATRQDSETAFLEWLLDTLGIRMLSECSPATLYRSVSCRRAVRRRLPFELIATRVKQFEGDFRTGDLMIRRIPGAGDIGHVSILASNELFEVDDLRAAGIASESAQPGRYGIVIEAGACPHTRSQPFARRLLDCRGRVLPHTIFLRTDYAAAYPVKGASLYYRDSVSTQSEKDVPSEDEKPQQVSSPQSPPSAGPLDIDVAEGDADIDIVLIIFAIEKPGDVAQYWHDNVKPNPTHWAGPLSDLEQNYLDAMTSSDVPEVLRMRSPVNPGQLTADEAGEAKRIFGGAAEDAIRYANYENRRRILAHYVTTHPATVALELGLYRLIRDVNPLHFALERGWQIGGGKEMFTELEVRRLGAAFEFVSSLAIVYGIGKVLEVAVGSPPRAATRALTDPIYDLPEEGGGMRINGRWYTEHALERMAPDTPQVRVQIRARVIARLEKIGIKSNSPAFDKILDKALKKIDPRGVPPSVVESEITKRGSTSVRVITARRGEVVVTVIPRHLLKVKPPVTESTVEEGVLTDATETAWEALPVETIPTFSAGTPTVHSRFVEMPLVYENYVPNTEGSGIVLQSTRCDTIADIEKVGSISDLGVTRPPGEQFRVLSPDADIIRSMSTTPFLWKVSSFGRLEANIDLVLCFPADAGKLDRLPAGTGKFPLTIVCMGNHNACSGWDYGPTKAGPFTALSGDAYRMIEATATNFKEILSHHGYSAITRPRPPDMPAGAPIPYLQEELAQHGIISASVNTNGANFFNLDLETRADYVLKAVEEMRHLAEPSGSIFHNRIDFDRVAFVGHSRGGDAVVRAALKAPKGSVRAVVQIAPTDITGLLSGTAPAPPDSNTKFQTKPNRLSGDLNLFHLLIYGSRDGDVSGWGDTRAAEFGHPFRHYDRSSSQRAFHFWHGATHNRFNRYWEDSDEDQNGLVNLGGVGLLERPDQENRAKELVGACLRFVLNDDAAEIGRLNGRTPTTIAPTRKTSAMWKFGHRLLTIDNFDDSNSRVNTLGGANTPPSNGLFDEVLLVNENPVDAGQTAFQFVHIDKTLRASFPSEPTPGMTTATPPFPSGRWSAAIPAGSRDFRGFDLITLRVTKRWDPNDITTAKVPVVKLRLRDSSGAAHEELIAGRLSALPDKRKVTYVPDKKKPAVGLRPLDLTKLNFETWEVALSAYSPVNLRNIVAVEVEAVGFPGQSIYMDTLSLVKL